MHTTSLDRLAALIASVAMTFVILVQVVSLAGPAAQSEVAAATAAGRALA